MQGFSKGCIEARELEKWLHGDFQRAKWLSRPGCMTPLESAPSKKKGGIGHLSLFLNPCEGGHKRHGSHTERRMG